MTVLRLLWLHLRIAIMNEAQYRVNFFAQGLQSLVALGTGLVVLSLVFRYAQTLAGWKHAELLAIMGVHILVGGIIKIVIQPAMLRVIDDVREGVLDFALTKPADSQVLVSVREMRVWQAVDVFLGIIVLGIAGRQLGSTLNLIHVLLFTVLLVLGALMLYSFWLMLATGAFWVVRMEFVVELFQGLYQTGRWPVHIYPEPLRIGLTFLVPVAFAVTVPAEALTARLTGNTVLAAAALTTVLLGVSRWVWTIGVRHYSGASA
jgi:ABC-2 type transport system permease protein